MVQTFKVASTHTNSETALYLGDLISELFDGREFIVSSFEIKENLWNFEILFPSEESWSDIASQIERFCPFQFPAFALDIVPENVRTLASQLELKPIESGRFLIHDAAHRCSMEEFITIEIDAGLAFGTGHHGTTYGCLKLIDEYLNARSILNPFDLGCGSGILAIALAKALNVPILASDVDPDAILVTQENAKINQVSHLLHLVLADGFDHEQILQQAPFDLIVANILSNPLIDLAQSMKKHIIASGLIILSGILIDQVPIVIASYEKAGFLFLETRTFGEWAVCVLKG